MAEDRKKSFKFRQSKGNNSAITDDTPIKLHMHNPTLIIYIQYKFHEIPSIGYLVMAEDQKSDGWMDGQTGRMDGRPRPNQYPSRFGRG